MIVINHIQPLALTKPFTLTAIVVTYANRWSSSTLLQPEQMTTYPFIFYDL